MSLLPTTYDPFMETNTNPCRRCGGQVPIGYFWHPTCLAAYRADEDYRRATLQRDGYNCASCPGWWNRIVAEWYVWRRSSLLGRIPGRTVRWVQVDHIDPLASATGTHDPQNMQVLCQGRPFRHHPRKTKRDLAALKGRTYRPPITRGQAIGVAVVVLVVAVYLTGFSWPLAVAAGALAVAVVLSHRRLSGARARLHEAYAQKTGASLAHARQALKTRKWRLRKVQGRMRPILVPTWQRIRYPITFDDSDPDKQAELERVVIAKNGDQGGWVAEWHTPLDELIMYSPDPLQIAAPIASPLLQVESTSVWQPTPVAHDSRRRPVTVQMIGKNWLLGGEPEAGKSVAQSSLVSALALDVTTDLLLNDLKGGVELGIWEGCSSQPVATTIEEAIAQAEYVRSIIDFRAALLRHESEQTGILKRKIEEGDGMGPIGVVVDELAELTAHPNKKERETYLGVLRSNISRGRFVGIIHVLATQRPSAQVVPTDIRDIINQRWALRHTTPTSSDMTLGATQAARGFSAHRVSMEARGVGYLYSDGRDPQRVRSYMLTDRNVQDLARKAARLRGGVLLPPGAAAGQVSV